MGSKNLSIYTDAGFKDGVSTHHWRIIDEDRKDYVVKRRTFKGYEVDSYKAEIQTINSALQYIEKKNFKNFTLYTDCQSFVNEVNGESEKLDIKLIQLKMKVYNIKIAWVPRETKQIKLADHYCSELMTTIFNRPSTLNEVIT